MCACMLCVYMCAVCACAARMFVYVYMHSCPRVYIYMCAVIALSMFQRVCAGIILDQSAVDVRNTVLKMVEYNNRNRTDTSDNRIVIEEDITTVDMDDSFRLSSTSQ